MKFLSVLASISHLLLSPQSFIAMAAFYFRSGVRKRKESHSAGVAAEGSSMPSKELHDPNLRIPSEQLFALVTARALSTWFRRGQIIFTQGTRTNALFAVKQGLVKLTVTAEDGKEVILDVVGSGDFVGEDVLISPGITRHYNAVCITATEVLKADSKRLSEDLKANADIAQMFFVYLLKKTRGVQEHLANCLLNPGTKRLLRTLIENQERLGRSEQLSQQTLGEMIGMTRQYVNVLLRGLRGDEAHRGQNTGVPTLESPMVYKNGVRHQQTRNFDE
jgi:CRP/FNR family transcriptional regulator, cyclic AMP receptor protein